MYIVTNCYNSSFFVFFITANQMYKEVLAQVEDNKGT